MNKISSKICLSSPFILDQKCGYAVASYQQIVQVGDLWSDLHWPAFTLIPSKYIKIKLILIPQPA